MRLQVKKNYYFFTFDHAPYYRKKKFVLLNLNEENLMKSCKNFTDFCLTYGNYIKNF